ncbi:uncharacterized protein N7498_008713 [Penicillium cinerascens]|uniref:Uncharacterized protein n=1 Tax=Penicillium cinerascens TaxID=70096 RepID=A0A9W9JE90_9EURO|nr:uncharacterized protein N7498_008713 [Penicillium cinerascens]KAJ5195275.1 hypothetical protein N7498_008713 [Penicillium cinerascens]
MADKSNPQESNPVHEHEHEGFFERILHHHKNKDCKHHDKDSQQPQDKKEEGEMDKMKDYLHKDEQLEEEGHEYGDLM